MDNDTIDLRSKCSHFRVLVIGRANAGKTTLLKKVCDSIEDPEIFDTEGDRIDAGVVDGSISRGLHDINNQLIFKSNPQYIFHDSRGFESGSIEETEKVKSFISKRAGGNNLSEQLHAIWYCLATDTNRPLLEADEDFFGTDVTGKGESSLYLAEYRRSVSVPVLTILTKCDAVVSDAFQELLDEDEDPVAALVDQRAQEMLDKRFVDPLKLMGYPPADYVQVMDMHENGDCEILITKTAGAVTNDVLRLLFVSVQQNNVDLCIRYAVEETLNNDYRSLEDIVRETLAWFPHVWLNDIIYEEILTPAASITTIATLSPLIRIAHARTFTKNVAAVTDILNRNYSHMKISVPTMERMHSSLRFAFAPSKPLVKGLPKGTPSPLASHWHFMPTSCLPCELKWRVLSRDYRTISLWDKWKRWNVKEHRCWRTLSRAINFVFWWRRLDFVYSTSM